jgi:hypothetical protein
MFAPPPPQKAGIVQADAPPQLSRPPQPSAMKPQFAVPQLVALVHAGAPHMLATPPPPQLSPAEQLPQARSPPHPSATGPHSPGLHPVRATHAPPSA